MTYREVDMSEYPRKAHFKYFRSMPFPFFSVTVMVDVTRVLAFCRKRSCSFYTVFIHLVARAANQVPEFRQRIHEGKIREYASCGTSHTEMTENGTYAYCTLYHQMDWDEYLSYAEQQRLQCRHETVLEEDAEVESMYFISSLPWLHYTQLSMPSTGTDSNPQISWGKFAANDAGKQIMPVTCQVHHALMDGFHVAEFYDSLNREIETLGS